MYNCTIKINFKSKFMEQKQTKASNNVAKIIKTLGFESVKPTEALLVTLGVTNRRFVKILDNRADMSSHELVTFSKWLSVKPNDLLNLQSNDGQ